MLSIFGREEEVVLGKYVSIATASSRSGYCEQYLRRLVRNGKLNGIKVSQIWFIDANNLRTYLDNAQGIGNARCGPRA